MWGVKAVFYVAVLVCLIGSSFAVDCNGHGTMGTDECICWSGYAPSDSCAASIGSCAGVAVSLTEASHFPSLAIGTSDTTFTGNTLHARIEAEKVVDRMYTSLNFSALGNNAQDPRCNLGMHSIGNGDLSMGFWMQNTSDTCNDTFKLNLPWSEHAKCGFRNDSASDSNYLILTGYLAITYTDKLGEIENFTLARTTKVPYSISVRFQKHVTVNLKALNVSSNVKFGMALTEDVYDPITGILTLELTTIVNWPNMFYLKPEYTKLYYPGQVLLQNVDPSSGALCNATSNNCGSTGFGFYAADDVTEGCSPDNEDSICKEIFTFKAKVNDQDPTKNCTFDGEYDLQMFLYTCRGTGSKSNPTCTSQVMNITWTIQDSNICGEIGITPDVTGTLVAYPPSYTSNFRTFENMSVHSFHLGDFGHFFAKIEAQNNIISLNFTEIKFSFDNGPTTYLYQKGSAPSKYVHIYDQSKYFRVEFHSSIFRVDPNSQLVYTFAATADIAFQGNDGFVTPNEDNHTKKRTIEYTWTQSTASAKTTAFIKNMEGSPAASKTEVAGMSSVTFIASVVGAVAGTMIIVFVVVGFALRTRSSKKDEPHASLIAASAAAEVVNRA